MPNALLSPDTSSYSDPYGNALLAKGWDGNQALQQIQGVQQIQRNQISLSSEQIALGRQKLQALNEVLGPVADDPTMENLQGRMADAIYNGKWTPEMYQTALQEVGKTDGSPGAIKRLALHHLAQNANIDQQLQMAGAGAPQYVNTGNQLTPVVPQSGMNPGFRPAGGGAIPLGMSPEADNAKTDWLDADGKVHQGTNAQFRQAAGAGSGAPTPGGSSPFVGAANGQGSAPPQPPTQARSPMSQGGAPLTPAAAPATWTPTAATMPVVTEAQATAAMERVQAKQGTPADRNVMRAYLIQNNMTQPKTGRGQAFEPQPGQPPKAVAPPQAPAAPVASAAPPQGGGIVGPKPGAIQAATVDADASAKQFAGVTAAAANLPNLKATVSTMEAQLPHITTGPQAAAWNKVKSGVNFGSELATGKDVFDPRAIAAQDEFHNQSVRLAQLQFQQLGGTGTDGQFASASGDVPNESLSNQSNSQLLAMNKGLIDAQQARSSAAQAWKERFGPASYGAFVDYWNKSFSPRAFQFNYLSPQERGVMLHSMSPQEKEQLKSAYDMAVANKWVAPLTIRAGR